MAEVAEAAAPTTDDPITFPEARDGAADDLRQIAGFLSDYATKVDDGDLGLLDELIEDRWSLWGQMLALRHYHRMERLRSDDVLEEKEEGRDDG